MTWVAPTRTTEPTHHAGVDGERSTDADQIWLAMAPVATVPAATAISRRGEARARGCRTVPPATFSCTQASAATTMRVRTTTENGPPESQVRCFHCTSTGCRGAPAFR